MRNIWILTQMTFQEALRQRIVLTGLVLGLCFLFLFSFGFHFIIVNVVTSSPGILIEGQNALLLTGLYAVTFLSVALGALMGADTLAGEITSGTIQTIVTKPIRRAEVVLGKWLGFAWLLGLYVLLTGGGTVLSVFAQTGYLAEHLAAGLALIYLEALLMMTLSLACSSTFSALATGGIVFGLYGLAFLGGWIEQFGAVLHNETAVRVGIIASLILPSEVLWRRAAYEMQTTLSASLGMSPFGAISVPSQLMIAYALVYLLAVLALTVRVFNRRDL